MTVTVQRTSSNVEHVLDLRPLTAQIGAEVHGLNIANPLSASEIDALRGALADWKVLFFRGANLDHAGHVAFARQFGPLTYPNAYDATYATSLDEPIPPPNRTDEEVRLWREYPEVSRLDNQRTEASRARYPSLKSKNSYHNVHIDSSPLLNPPTYSVLRTEIVPSIGGDTFWFDAVAAYEGLSERVRSFVDTLWAEHRLTLPPHREDLEARVWTTHHPIVRTIPESGARALLLSPQLVTRVLDVSADESAWILEFLHREVTRPGYAVRFKWDRGDLAISDNRTTVHLGPQDLGPDDERLLYLVIVAGETPVSTDGRSSVAVDGKPKPDSPRPLEFADGRS